MNESTELFAAIVFWAVVFGFFGGLIGRSRGRVGSGVVWSIMFGPLGMIITMFLPDLSRRCDWCRSKMIEKAVICHKCGRGPVTNPRR